LFVGFVEFSLGVQRRQDHVLTWLYDQENFHEFCRRESLKTCIVYWRLCFAVVSFVTAVKSMWVAWQPIKWPKV